MPFDATQAHTKPNAFWLIMIQASTLLGLSHVTALTWKGLNCGVKERDKHEPTVQKSRSPYSRMKDICLWSHIALTRAVNVSMHSFPLPLIAYELICHSNQVGQHYHKTQTSFIRMKPKLKEIWKHIESAPNFIAQDHHSQQEVFEKNKFREWNLDKKKMNYTL
jgi:hypothetical protein